jgi:hypothetical protein
MSNRDSETVRLPRALRQRLHRHAAAHGIEPADCTRQLIERALASSEIELSVRECVDAGMQRIVDEVAAVRGALGEILAGLQGASTAAKGMTAAEKRALREKIMGGKRI